MDLKKFFYIGQLCSSDDPGLSAKRKVKHQLQGYMYLGETDDAVNEAEGYGTPRARILAGNGTVWMVDPGIIDRITTADGDLIKGAYATKRYLGRMTRDELSAIEKPAMRDIKKLTTSLNKV